ncbi:HigA family addiction module antitoxin [Herbaspirillum robiniae]|uniref:Addiction module antidote protein, HigA family n=1 Tax=Herbaspirillum robiniae TaxID=2014887 RepID=A0A246WP37_9BURK|nr:HigA family addiction module antitoxin [Herbaspirillum robiniae]OWY28126.1 addiction module antidote protein, HigA family [Herbaspirillum robiniae]
MRTIHPGEVLVEDYIEPAGMSIRSVAMALSIPYARLNAIAKGKRPMDADLALRLERYFGSEALGWLNLQTAYDLRIAGDSAGNAIAKAITPLRLPT